MAALIEIGLMNAPMALGLACLVWIIGRCWKRPAVLHILWVLVLVKLLVPPLIPVSLPWHLPAWMDPSVSARPDAAATSISSDTLAPDAAVASVWPDTVTGAIWLLRSLFVIALCVWAVGSILWFCLEGWRIVRFAQVFLRHARPAPKSMQRHANTLARDMGMKRSPDVWLLTAPVSPMLWCVGGRARILFPSELTSHLDKASVATLLTHELAHFYRGDHWVRMLEFVVTGLFWWHPAVWVARREIEIHEEQCCDAWVVGQFPKTPRQYAAALLATIDFLSEERTILPAAASGLGDAPLIRQRLILIMRGVAPKSLCLTGRLAVAAMALLVLVQPRLAPRAVASTPSEIKSQAPAKPKKSVPEILPRKFTPPGPRLQDFDGIPRQSIPDSSLSKRRTKKVPVPRTLTRSSGRDVVPGQGKTKALGKSPKTRAEWLVWAMATAPNTLSRVVAHDNGKVLWQHFCTDEAADLSGFEISTVAYTPEGQIFVAGCRDGAVRVWDATNGRLLQTLVGHASDVRAVAISPQGNWLVSGDQAGEVRLWSVLERRSSELLSNYCTPISSLAFSEDGKTVAVATGAKPSDPNHLASRDSANRKPDETSGGIVALWDMLERVEIKQIRNVSPLAVIVFSFDSRQLSGAEWSGRVLTWNIGSSELLATHFVDRKAVTAAAFSSDGSAIRPVIGAMF